MSKRLLREYIRLVLSEDTPVDAPTRSSEWFPGATVAVTRKTYYGKPVDKVHGDGIPTGQIVDHDEKDDDLIDEDEEEEEGPEADEVSVVANIRGYTGPLGTAPDVPGGKKRKKPHWQPTADTFARAKPVGI